MGPIYRCRDLASLIRMCESLLDDPHVNRESLVEVRRIRCQVEYCVANGIWVK